MNKHYNVVAAVVRHDGKYLCLQRGVGKSVHTSLRWEFPGGKIEQEETPREALHREMLEEMDYDVEVGDLLCTVEHAYPDFSITLMAFLCSASSADFVLKEHVAYVWADAGELESLDWCAADIAIVDAVVRR